MEIEVQSSIGADFDLMAVFERTEHPALGRHGGAAKIEVLATSVKMMLKTLINGAAEAPPLGFRQCCL